MMQSYIFFDSALQIFVVAYLISTVLLLAAAKIGLAVIETFEEIRD